MSNRYLTGVHGYLCLPTCQEGEKRGCQEPGECIYIEQMFGVPTPMHEASPDPKEVLAQPEPEREFSPSKRWFDLLEQTALKANYLEKRLNELQARKKPRGQY